MFKKYVYFILYVFCFSDFFGQTEEFIVTDRPSQTEVPKLVSKDYLQIEIGFQKELNNGGVYLQYPSILWKYSLFENFELRFITEYLGFKKIDIDKDEISLDGFSPLTIGFKTQILKQKGIIPNLSITSHFTLPYVGYDFFRPNHIVPRFRVVSSHDLNEKVSLLYNFGMQWEDGFNVPIYMYTFLIAYSLNSKISMFLESYGYIKKDVKLDNRFDAGFSYLLGDFHQLDFSGGLGFSYNSLANYISIGYSFRVKTKKDKDEGF